MEEYESYLENFKVNYKAWNDMMDGEHLDIKKRDQSESPLHHVRRLPRRDVPLYGFIPKMESKSYCLCKECKLIFHPKNILLHKSCSYKERNLYTHKSKKNIKSKKLPLPIPPKFSETAPIGQPSNEVTGKELLPPKMSTSSSKLSSPKPLMNVENVADIPLPSTVNVVVTITATSSSEKKASDTKPSTKFISISCSTTRSSTSSSSSSSGSKSKKSKKSSPSSSSKSSSSSKKIASELCGVVDGSKGPCTRSLSCSTHRVQLKKEVLTKSSEVKELLKERKPKERKTVENFCQGISFGHEVPFDQGNENHRPPQAEIISLLPEPDDVEVTECNGFPITTSNSLGTLQINIEQINSPIPEFDFYPNQENLIPQMSPTFDFLSVSPVSVISPLQNTEDSDITVMSSPQPALSPLIYPKQIYLPLPDRLNANLYHSHPKPSSLPLYGTRKVGGASVFSRHRMGRQRNDVLVALNTKRKPTNIMAAFKPGNTMTDFETALVTNLGHRPNILRSRTNVNSRPINRVLLGDDDDNDDEDEEDEFIRLTSSSEINGFAKLSDLSEVMMQDDLTTELSVNLNGDFTIHADITDETEKPQITNFLPLDREKISFKLK